MTTSKTSKILMDEHKNILKVVDALEKECEKIAKGEFVNEDFLKKTIDFIRNYADKFHHAKEEDILFKEFENAKAKKESHCNPTEQMLYEHDLGRKYVAGIEIGMNKRNRKMIIENAMEYVYLIRDHISKEDNVLFPMTDDALDKKAKDKMLIKFNKVIKERENSIKPYLSFVEECEKWQK